MTNDAYIAALLHALLLPPGLSFTLLGLGYLCPNERGRVVLFALGFLSLYVASIPVTALWLRSRLEVYPPITLGPNQSSAEAIVVLGADRYAGAPEYSGDTLRGLGLERLRYAAWLQKRTQLPILVSGGAVLGEATPEAALMRQALEKEFGAEVRWEEGESKTTYENALFSARVLKGAGVGEIMLVTHAWAMPRAAEAFEQAGLKVVPAPTGFTSKSAYEAGVLGWLPSASALLRTHLALHEMTGRWWYWLRHFRNQRSSGEPSP